MMKALHSEDDRLFYARRTASGNVVRGRDAFLQAVALAGTPEQQMQILIGTARGIANQSGYGSGENPAISAIADAMDRLRMSPSDKAAVMKSWCPIIRDWRTNRNSPHPHFIVQASLIEPSLCVGKHIISGKLRIPPEKRIQYFLCLHVQASMASPPQQIHRLLNHGMWMAPLLVAAVVHRYPSLQHQSLSTEADSKLETREKTRPLRTDVSTVFAELEEADESANAHRIAKSKTLNPAQLRQRLLELDALPGSDPFRENSEESYSLAYQLGHTEGATGVKWLTEHLPKLRDSAHLGWAAKDPQSFLDFVVSSQRAHPCSSKLLMSLIDQQTHGDPTALMELTSQVPWQLFDPTTVSGFDDLAIPEGALQTWLDSGVARSLAERGLRVSGIFGPWFDRDPQKALSSWADWPGSAESKAYDLEEILRQTGDSDEKAKQLLETVSQADDGTAAKLQDSLKSISKNNPMLVKELQPRLPGLFPKNTENP